jgi:hypothetical protein
MPDLVRLARATVLLAALLLPVPRALAEQAPLSADRPGVGTSADTVPRGALQLETGLDYARERRAGEPTQRRAALVTTVRFGLLDGVELRLDGEPIVALRGEADVTDVGDVLLGAKLRVREGGEGWLHPTLALFPAVKLPTAPDPIGSERADMLLLGLASFELGRLTLDLNAGLAAVAQRDPSGYLVQALVVGSLGVEVVNGGMAFAELFYTSPSERDGRDLAGAGAGVSYAVTPNLAVDGAVIVSLAGRGPDYRLRTGITVRFWP